MPTSEAHVSMIDVLFATPTEKATAAIAAASTVTTIVAPDWHTRMAEYSSLAATLLPILSAFWLVIQIALRLDEWWQKRAAQKDD